MGDADDRAGDVIDDVGAELVPVARGVAVIREESDDLHMRCCWIRVEK